MDGTYYLAMGDRGRVVVPAEVRERYDLVPGTRLIMLETPRGLLVLTRAQLKSLVRDKLAGLPLVEELLEERRRAAAAEDLDALA